MKEANNFFREESKLDPEVFARGVLRDLGINSLPIDPKYIAEKMGFTTDERPFHQDNVDGLLIRDDEGGFVVINSNIQYEPRKRFTYAHELGHAFIPWHRSQTEYRCSNLSIAGIGGDPVKEREANSFAAELMMPSQLFEYDVARTPFNFDSLSKLAEEKYSTSLQATALRFARFTVERCAVVLIHKGIIQWSYCSRTFKEKVRTGKKVTNLTHAFDFFDSGVILDGKSNEVYAKAWIETSDPDRIIKEQSRSFQDLEMVLTLLEFPTNELNFSDNEDEEEIPY